MTTADRLRLAGVQSLAQLIRDVRDFPKKGIVFKDITPVLRDASALALAVEFLAQPWRGEHVDLVAGVESRGFILGAAVAQTLSAGFVPIRKPGKLPWKKRSATYQLEYGTDTVEIHEDAVTPGERVLMVDDLLATGGTMAASCELVESLGGQIIGVAFLVELAFLAGRKKLTKHSIHSLIGFDQ